MKRYFYISDDLHEFESLAAELEENGLSKGQMHVLSNSDDEAERRNLNQVYSWFKTDVMSSTYVGVLIGVIFAFFVTICAYYLGLRDYLGWTPFVFLALLALGFSTWEAGFIGTQIPNRKFRRFQSDLDSGRHILQVDCGPADEPLMREVVARHMSRIREAGTETTSDRWIIVGEKKFRQFIEWAP